MQKLCSVNGCERPHYARTWCSKHYKRWLAHGHPEATAKPRYSSPEEHFRHYMPGPPPTSECWIWTGVIPGNDGYGVFIHQRRNYRAHRVSYEIFVGPIPEGMVVMHTCDVPLCVNPNHLTVGSDFENVQDKVRKSRQGGGGAPKLTPSAVVEIRRIAAAREVPQSELARHYGVTIGTIEHVVAHKTWRNVS